MNELERQIAARAWDQCALAFERYARELERSRLANLQAGEGWPVAKPKNPYKEGNPNE